MEEQNEPFFQIAVGFKKKWPTDNIIIHLLNFILYLMREHFLLEWEITKLSTALNLLTRYPGFIEKDEKCKIH